MRSRVIRRIVGLFLLLITALLVSSLLSYRATSRIVTGESWLIHTYTVLETLNAAEASYQQAENRAYKYINSHDPADIRSFDQVAADFQSTLNDVRTLTTDNPLQQSNV